MRGILRSREFIVFVILILISMIIGVRNPLFFSAATLFDLIRGSIVYCIMALGVLMVLVSGNVDISFVAIAAMTSYTTHMLFLRLHYEGGILFYLLLATSLGFGIGFLMGVISTRFQLPVFYVSLGYQTLWYGFTLFFLGRNINFKLPKGLVGYYSRFLFRVKDPIAGESGLHVSVLYLAVITLFIFWLLNYTAFGRGLYAMGGNKEAAIRAGFDVRRITALALACSGALAAIAGVVQNAYSRSFNPVLFMGKDLDVIAAVVLGGAAITGGQGTVLGTILGVFLIQVLTRGLIFMGVSAEWQRMVTGLVLIVFISVPVFMEKRRGYKKQVAL